MASESLGTAHVTVAPVIAKGTGEEIQKTIAKEVDGSKVGKKIGEDLATGVGGGKDAGAEWGKTFGAGLAAVGIGTLFADQMNTAMSLDGGTTKLTAQLGLTAKESEKYGAIAGDLYSSAYGDSMEGTQEAVYAVLGSIQGARGKTAKEVEGMAADILNITATAGASTEEITRAAQSAVNSGLVKDFDGAMDLITKGYQQTGQAGLDWADTVNEYGGDFTNLGFSAEESLGLISGLVKSGARNTDVAADGIREFGIRMREGSDATKEALSGLGLDADSMIAKFKAGGPEAKAAFEQVTGALNKSGDAAAYAAIFGTQAEDNFKAFSTTDFSGAITSAGDMSTAAEDMNKTLGGDASSAGQSFSRTLETMFSEILLPMLDKATPMLQDMVSIFKENKDIIAAIGAPLLFIVGTFAGVTAAISAYNSVSAIWKGVTVAQTVAQWAMNSALLANPIVLVIVAILAIIAALVWFFTQTELGKEVWANVTAAIGAAITWLWESVLQPVFKAIGDLFVWLWESIIKPIGDFFVMVFNAIGAAVTWLWTTVIQPIFGFISGVFQVFATVVTWLWVNIIQPIFALIGGIFLWLFDMVIKVVVDLIVGYIQIWANIFTWLYANIIQPIFKSIGDIINWVWASVIQPVFSAIGGAVSAIGEAFGTVFGAIGGVIKNAFNGAVDFIKGVINNIIDLINGVIGSINGVAAKVKEATGGKVDVTLGTIPKLAAGATINPTNGGTTVTVAEAGKPESVVDTGLLNSQMKELSSLKANNADNRRSSVVNITVNGDGKNAKELANEIGRVAAFSLRVQPN